MQEVEILAISSEKKYQCIYQDDKQLLKVGDEVLISNEQMIEIGKIMSIKNKRKIVVEKGDLPNADIAKIIRKIDVEDHKKLVELKEKAKSYLPKCQEKIKKHGLSMKLLDADLSYDEKRLTFYFGAEGRIDFRDLLKDLITNYKKTIRLQQIGSRDEAKIFGGFGKCGRPLCCKVFLKDVDSITLEMAKLQNISSGISKISGVCGKLMCCLSYELEEYKKLKKNFPALGQLIKTGKGQGEVIEQNILLQTIKVRLKDGQTTEVAI